MAELNPNILLGVESRAPQPSGLQKLAGQAQQFRQGPFRQQILEQQAALGAQNVATGEREAEQADTQKFLVASQTIVNSIARGDDNAVVSTISSMFPDPVERDEEIAEYFQDRQRYGAELQDSISANRSQAGGKPVERKIAADASGRKRFIDTGEAVFSEVKSPEDLASEVKASKTKFDQAAKIRGEVAKATGVFADIEDSFSRVQAATSGKITAASDLALIFNFMKMLDPGSVVREGEFATAQNAEGVPGRIQNTYNRLLTGERLNPKQRENFKDEAGKQFDASLKVNNSRVADFVKMGERFGLERGDIIVRSDQQPTQQQDTGITADQFRAMTAEQRAAKLAELQQGQ